MSFLVRARPLTLGATIGLVLGSPVFAQAPAAAGVQLEEVVVTAQRTESNLQQTPISVTAVSGERLTQQGASTLLDLASFIPNLQVGSTSLQGAGNGRFAIRGIGQEAGTQASVGLYIDEVYYPTGAGNLMGLFDVDRVEVLRGPQGTLFGRNTIGGAIQYVTAKPDQEFGGYGEATWGKFQRADFNGALNIPLGDRLAARVALGYNSRDGYVADTLNNVNRGADTRRAARLQLRWTPTDDLTVDLKGERLTNENNGRAATIHGYAGSPFPTGQNDAAQFMILGRQFSPTPYNVHLCPPTGGPVAATGPCLDAQSTGEYQAAGYGSPEYNELKYSAGSLLVNWKLNEAVSVKSITGYSVTKVKSAIDFDATPASFLTGLTPLNDTKALSQELQLALMLLDNRLRWTTGLYYYDQENDTKSTNVFGTATPVAANASGNRNGLTSKAIFTQGTFEFTSRLSGTAGLRYSRETARSRTLSAAGVLGREIEATFADTSPQVGLQFQATDDQMYYIKGAKGTRAGGFGTNIGYVNGFKKFDPEEAWTYELGARLEFLDRRLRVNPTAFFTDWKGIQVNSLVTVPEPGVTCPPATNNCPGVGTVPQNVGDIEIRGLEAEVLFQATQQLSLQASVGYLDSKYARVNDIRGQIYPVSTGGLFGGPVFIPNLCDGSGDPTLAQLNPNRTAAQLAPLVALYECQGASDLSRSPKLKYSFGARYAHPLSEGAEIVGSADYGWTDKQRSQVANLDQTVLPSFGVLNARLQYTAPNDRWSLALFGTNLTDQYYYTGATDFAAGYTPGTTVWDPARPREVGVSLHFKF